jgi:ribosomal protein S18 acetylase RimI-like enzyme
VRTEELLGAARLLLSTPHRPADDEAVTEFLHYAAARGMDTSQMHGVISTRGQVLWSVLPVVSPGRTMLLLVPPTGVQPRVEPLARQLLAELLDQYRARDVQIAQVLLEPEHIATRRFLISCGFSELAELIYLQRQVRKATAVALPDGLHWQTYTPQTHALFVRTIEASYERSLDCPALNGTRKIDDVIEGHRAAGRYDPAIWFLLMQGDTALGVLLLSHLDAQDALELVYLGLPLSSRGRGLGDLLLKQALAIVWREQAARLSLAVDSRNAPALSLYHRYGMQRVCSRMALLRPLQRGAALRAESASISTAHAQDR